MKSDGLQLAILEIASAQKLHQTVPRFELFGRN